jgi:hypothetical protein
MKYLVLFGLISVIACTSKVSTTTENPDGDTIAIVNTDVAEEIDTTNTSFVQGNERFKDVSVTRLDSLTFRVRGKAQVFEANFGWVIEDGHDELQSGNHMTDAGAPEWGNFDFKVMAQKNDPNTTLHLVLFESSAKDGSRQYELPVRLY